MKANELMVGDYLMHNGFPYRVIQVDGIVRDGWMIENGEEDCGEPIPITPEILEKNWFKRDPLWHHCDKDFDNYTISVQLGYANKIEYIKIAEKGKDEVVPSERTKLYLTHIKYVHQLQHALRLCGISKEIEL